MILSRIKRINFANFFKLSFICSLILVTLSIIILLTKGLNLGVDFKGGTLIELRMDNKDIKISKIRNILLNLEIGDVSVKNFGSKGDFLIKLEKNKDSKITIVQIKKELTEKTNSEANFRRVENVGPKVSKELINAGLIAISLSLAAMLIYIWIRFEWQFSVSAIIALIHDVLISVGIFSLFSFEVNLSIVAAVLTIVGYSMNDTVVIFDRIRENLRKYEDIILVEINLNKSISDTLSRTLITSITTLLALFSIYIFGGEILKGFSFAMILGVIIGTYSSIFIATPCLNYFQVSKKTVSIKEED